MNARAPISPFSSPDQPGARLGCSNPSHPRCPFALVPPLGVRPLGVHENKSKLEQGALEKQGVPCDPGRMLQPVHLNATFQFGFFPGRRMDPNLSRMFLGKDPKSSDSYRLVHVWSLVQLVAGAFRAEMLLV